MALDTTIGGASSDSYITLTEWETYATNMGWTTAGTDAVKEAYLRRATLYLDRNYIWLGTKKTAAAARQWPRSMSELVDGYVVDSDAIPQAIKDAQAELAWIAHEGTDLFATVTTGAVTKSRVKVDVIEEAEEYQGALELPKFTAVTGLLAQYTRGMRIGGGYVSADMVR